MLLLALSTVFASEIQVTARGPVVVSIDGAPAGIAGTLIDTKDLDPGPHRVEIRNFVGAMLADGVFQLGEGERLRLTYDKHLRVLTELDRVPLTSPVQPPAPVSELPKPRPRPAPPEIQLSESPTASLLVTGLSDISGEVRIGGEAVPFASDAQGFLAQTLTPPVVELHIQDNGKLRYHGATEITAGGHTACHLQFNKTAWTVDCKLEGPEIPVD